MYFHLLQFQISFITVHLLLRGLAFLQNINGYLHLAKVREEQNKVKSKENKSKRTKRNFSSFLQHNPANVMI